MGAECASMSRAHDAALPGRRAGLSVALTPVRGTADLVAGAILALVGALGARFLPDGDGARVALAAPVLLVVPGYLLIQTFVIRTETGHPRWFHVFFGIGLSPAVVGLLALATTVIPNGFQPAMIVAFVTVGCLLLAVVARMRRFHAIAADQEKRAVPKGVVSHSPIAQ